MTPETQPHSLRAKPTEHGEQDADPSLDGMTDTQRPSKYLVAASAGARMDDDAHLASVVRMVGHDLRNKLGIMLNSVYYVNMKVGEGNARLSKHLGILNHEIDIANQVIANLMDLLAAKLPSPQPTALSRLVHQATERFGPATERLALDLPIDGTVLVDAEQVLRAISNVLAFQLGTLEESCTIRVQLRKHRSRIYLEMLDSGPGLTRNELSSLEDPTQGDGLASLRMGLLVARRLTEANGGSLQVESRKNVGTRFSLLFKAV